MSTQLVFSLFNMLYLYGKVRQRQTRLKAGAQSHGPNTADTREGSRAAETKVLTARFFF